MDLMLICILGFIVFPSILVILAGTGYLSKIINFIEKLFKK